MSNKYDSYSWIKVSRYRDNPELSWEERFKRLEQHHVEETTFLIEKVRELDREIESLKFLNKEEYESFIDIIEKINED